MVQPRQNVSTSSSSGWDFSVTFNGSAITEASFSVNGADANRTYTDTPTTISAENTLDIYTQGTTFLLGSVLNSKTGDLVFDNYNDVDQSQSTSFGVSLDLQTGDLSDSDAHGSIAYANTQAVT
ncbi:MAG: hypothetical protein GY746_01585, partial [Gammaproteobacteria bacterium]|nr:hypothetical protein [Gammaproteobacteria bacterium]